MNKKDLSDFPEGLQNVATNSLVRGLCEFFSSDEFGVDCALAARLNRIAWRILLKKSEPINRLESSGVLEYVHPAILFSLQGDRDIENEVALKLEELEKIENEDWIGDVLKVLLCLHLSKSQNVPERTKTVQDLYREIVQKSILNSECMPKLKVETTENNIITCDTSIRIKNRDTSDETLREILHGVFSWPDESDDDVASSLSSTFNIDEGFVTPGNEVETSGSDDVQHYLFDLPNDDMPNASPSRCSWFTENTSSNESMFYDAKYFSIYPKEPSFSSREILKFAQLGHHETNRILSYEKFIHDLKALLIGISSCSFFKVDGKFAVKERICVIGLSTALMKNICKTFISVGDNYLRLEKCHKQLNSSSSVILKAMAPCLENFFYKYQTIINNISSEQSMLLIKKRIALLGEQIKFLVYLFIPLPVGISLLNSFYSALTRSQLPSPYSQLVSIFFYSGCNAYFALLDQWLFYGKTHPELFIEQNVSAEELVECSKSREHFKKAFTLNPKKAPCFLSAHEIYECGAYLVLLNFCSKNNAFDFKSVERPCIQLCCDMEQLKKLKNDCKKFYDCCSSQVTFKWLPQFNIDLREIAIQREANAAKIYSDIKSLEKVLLHQKQTAQLNIYRETLYHELEAAFIQLQDDVNYNLLLKHEEQLHNKKLEDRAIKYLNDLLAQFEKLKKENDKVTRRVVWKQKRLKLTEKRNQFLSNGGIDFQVETKSAEKYTCSIEENVDNLAQESVVQEQVSVEEPNQSPESSKNYLSPETRSNEFFTPTDNLKLNIPSSGITSRQVSEYETCSDMTEEDQLDDSNQSSFSTCTNDYTVQISEDFKTKFREIKNEHMLIKGYDNSHDPFLIKELVTKSIKIPLKVQNNLVNEALFYLFCEENRLFEHFSKMRNYFFLYDGVYAQKLTESLFTAVKKKEPMQFLTFPNLGSILNEACGNENRKEFFFDVTNTPPSFDHTNPQVLDCLKLSYKPEWNISLILTDATIEKYNTVFLFLLAIEQAAWHLKKLMFLLKIKYVDLNRSPKYKQIQLHRHVMFQFITAIKHYLAVVVFDTSWNNFTKKLFQNKSIEELYKSHCAYIKDIRFRCFLNSSSSSTLEHLMKILHQILVYCHVYEFGETEIKPSGRFHHQKYPKLEHTFNNFMAEAKYFTYLIETYSRNEQQHHFEILLEYLHTWSRLK